MFRYPLLDLLFLSEVHKSLAITIKNANQYWTSNTAYIISMHWPDSMAQIIWAAK